MRLLANWQESGPMDLRCRLEQFSSMLSVMCVNNDLSWAAGPRPCQRFQSRRSYRRLPRHFDREDLNSVTEADLTAQSDSAFHSLTTLSEKKRADTSSWLRRTFILKLLPRGRRSELISHKSIGLIGDSPWKIFQHFIRSAHSSLPFTENSCRDFRRSK